MPLGTPRKEPDYKVLFESAAGLYVVFDRELRIVAASDAYLNATMTRREAVVGKTLSEVFPARKALERVFNEGVVDSIALERCDLPKPGGGLEERYWSVVSSPVFGADGAVELVISSVEDVTDFVRLHQHGEAAAAPAGFTESTSLRLMREVAEGRRRAESAGQALRASEQRLRKVLNVDAVGVVFFDAGGTMISANDTFLRWSGYAREDLAARALSWQRLTPPEWHQASLEQLERLAATGRIGPYEKEYLCKDGSRRWMLFVGASLDDGTIVEYVLDIGQRKQAEQAQRESEERYRTLFESIDAGFCVIEMIYDAQGKPVDYRFLEVNHAFEEQTGLKDATRRTMREHVPGHEQHWFDTYHRVAETGEPVRFVNEAKPLMGGWYEVYAYRVGGPGSRKVAVLFNDITERVRAVEALKEAGRRKDEFLATLAHELRNPLAPIRNALTFMRIKGLPDPKLQQARELIDRQVDHLVRLVDDLLDMSRITFGKVELRRELVDLAAVAQEAVATSRPLLDEAGHRLTVRIAPEPLWVDGDRVRLLQVISNLLNNAARYTPPGGEVLLEVEKAGGEALVGVEDNGVGIPGTMLDRVFDAFIQLRQPASGETGREAPGTAAGIGIGLSLARMLVELHGGRISAESAGPGRGSRFVVRLPLVEAASLAPPEKARADAAGQPRRFLVVDDNADAALSQAELLRMLGHEAETAYSGQEALRKAARFRPEVVLLDLGMPGMDGFEVARELRRMPEAKEATLIAQTGWGQEEDRRRTAAAGFDAHLAKPVELGVLMETLARTGQD